MRRARQFFKMISMVVYDGAMTRNQLILFCYVCCVHPVSDSTEVFHTERALATTPNPGPFYSPQNSVNTGPNTSSVLLP